MSKSNKLLVLMVGLVVNMASAVVFMIGTLVNDFTLNPVVFALIAIVHVISVAAITQDVLSLTVVRPNNKTVWLLIAFVANMLCVSNFMVGTLANNLTVSSVTFGLIVLVYIICLCMFAQDGMDQILHPDSP